MLRMIERRERIWLRVRTRAMRSGSARNAVEDDLDGDLAPELRVARAIDLAHAAGADGEQDFVSTQTSAGGERHELGVHLRVGAGADILARRAFSPNAI